MAIGTLAAARATSLRDSRRLRAGAAAAPAEPAVGSAGGSPADDPARSDGGTRPAAGTDTGVAARSLFATQARSQPRSDARRRRVGPMGGADRLMRRAA